MSTDRPRKTTTTGTPVVAAPAQFPAQSPARSPSGTFASNGQSSGSASAAKRQVSPAVLGAAGVVLAVTLGLWAFDPFTVGTIATTNLSHPPTFEDASSICPKSGAAAAAKAMIELQAAEAHEERYPFAPGDGSLALQAFGQAASCFAATGDSTMARLAVQARDAMLRRLRDDLRNTQMRLERARADQRYAQALHESERLLSLCQHHPGPYRDELQRLQTELQGQLESASLRSSTEE